MRYVSILRGINVSGQKKIKMNDLAELYESIGFTDVETYIQSGNVAFNTTGKPVELAGSIEKGIEKQYGFDVPVMVLGKSELQKIIEANPYAKKSNIDLSKLHVTFLESDPIKEVLKSFEPPASGNDELTIKARAIFLHCPLGYGRTKLTNTFLEKKLAVRATTRNWKTVNKLLEMAG